MELWIMDAVIDLGAGHSESASSSDRGLVAQSQLHQCQVQRGVVGQCVGRAGAVCASEVAALL